MEKNHIENLLNILSLLSKIPYKKPLYIIAILFALPSWNASITHNTFHFQKSNAAVEVVESLYQFLEHMEKEVEDDESKL